MTFLAYIQDSDPPTNVRSQPNADSDKVGTLTNGTVIIVIETPNDKWLKISEPIAGYVSASLARTGTPIFDRDDVGSIAAWQHLVNGCGYHPDRASKLELTDQFDAATVAVTRKFQRDLELAETGRVDIHTWRAAFDHNKIDKWLPILPDRNQVGPPADHLSESEKYDYCRQVIENHGGKFQDEISRRNLLSFRQETSTKASNPHQDNLPNNWQGIYDDWTYLIWKDSSGQKHCRKYKSSTEPSSWFEDSNDLRAGGPEYGRDANGDGRKDLGRLQEGYYEYQIGSSNRYSRVNYPSPNNVLKPTEEARTVIRDIDHDGIFEANEPMLGANDMFFHTGRDDRTGSAGCQTMPPDEYSRFWKDLTANGSYNPEVIGYTIVRWRSLAIA